MRTGGCGYEWVGAGVLGSVTPSFADVEKSYPVFDDHIENTFLIWLPMNWLDNIFDKIFDSLINEYHNKNVNLLKV